MDVFQFYGHLVIGEFGNFVIYEVPAWKQCRPPAEALRDRSFANYEFTKLPNPSGPQIAPECNGQLAGGDRVAAHQ
jgi:hypothetical protein